MIEVVNRQRKLALDIDHWQEFSNKALKVLPDPEADATVAFVSDRTMRSLNQRWRGKQGTTDVLSFPEVHEEFEGEESANLGDVIISVDQAARQAKENGLLFETEIAQLILHGLLHLSGYDHATDKGEMNRLEIRLRRKLSIDK